MRADEKKNNAGDVLNWFDPRHRQPGTWAFILNRITGLGLTLYLFLHLLVLGLIVQGPEAWDGFLKLAHNPLVLIGELLVVAAVFIHGLNGLRIVLTTFGVGVAHQKEMFYAFMVVAVICSLVFAVIIFTAG